MSLKLCWILRLCCTWQKTRSPFSFFAMLWNVFKLSGLKNLRHHRNIFLHGTTYVWRNKSNAWGNYLFHCFRTQINEPSNVILEFFKHVMKIPVLVYHVYFCQTVSLVNISVATSQKTSIINTKLLSSGPKYSSAYLYGLLGSL